LDKGAGVSGERIKQSIGTKLLKEEKGKIYKKIIYTIR
jgi:hypothetical protein